MKKKFLKILVMGLPGAGKTYMANILSKKINAYWINADQVRKENNDWDFSHEGRRRQANRMFDLCEKSIKNKKDVVADFVCPTEKTRKMFKADLVIWMDTIKKGRFEDTNQMFEEPKQYDFRVKKFDAENISEEIIKKIKRIKED